MIKNSPPKEGSSIKKKSPPRPGPMVPEQVPEPVGLPIPSPRRVSPFEQPAGAVYGSPGLASPPKYGFQPPIVFITKKSSTASPLNIVNQADKALDETVTVSHGTLLNKFEQALRVIYQADPSSIPLDAVLFQCSGSPLIQTAVSWLFQRYHLAGDYSNIIEVKNLAKDLLYTLGIILHPQKHILLYPSQSSAQSDEQTVAGYKDVVTDLTNEVAKKKDNWQFLIQHPNGMLEAYSGQRHKIIKIDGFDKNMSGKNHWLLILCYLASDFTYIIYANKQQPEYRILDSLFAGTPAITDGLEAQALPALLNSYNAKANPPSDFERKSYTELKNLERKFSKLSKNWERLDTEQKKCSILCSMRSVKESLFLSYQKSIEETLAKENLSADFSNVLKAQEVAKQQIYSQIHRSNNESNKNKFNINKPTMLYVISVNDIESEDILRALFDEAEKQGWQVIMIVTGDEQNCCKKIKEYNLQYSSLSIFTFKDKKVPANWYIASDVVFMPKIKIDNLDLLSKALIFGNTIFTSNQEALKELLICSKDDFILNNTKTFFYSDSDYGKTIYDLRLNAYRLFQGWYQLSDEQKLALKRGCMNSVKTINVTTYKP